MERRDFLVVGGGAFTATVAGCVSEETPEEDEPGVDDEQEPENEEPESEEPESEEPENNEPEGQDGFGSFRAESQGGVIGLSSDNQVQASANGLIMPAKADDVRYVAIEGEVENGTWESTLVQLPRLRVNDSIVVELSAPEGLTGEFDAETGLMTLEGPIRVSLGSESFEADLSATTAESNTLEGTAEIGDESGTVTLVDNEFVVPESTDNELINNVLGLPAGASGRNWFELTFHIEEGATGEAYPEGQPEAIASATEGVPPTSDPDKVKIESGFLGFDMDTETQARESGLTVPAGEEFFKIETVSSGDRRWETSYFEFPAIEKNGTSFAVEFPDGLGGETTDGNGILTAEGVMRLVPEGDQDRAFQFRLESTSDESGALTGDVTEWGRKAKLVDNGFTVEDTTGDEELDEMLGLPATESGQNWFVIDFEFQ